MEDNTDPQGETLAEAARRIVENLPHGPTLRERLGVFTKAELAETLGISGRTLENWLSAGIAPPHARLNSLVWFREADVQKWLAALAGSGADTTPAGVSQRTRDAMQSLPRHRRAAKAAAG